MIARIGEHNQRPGNRDPEGDGTATRIDARTGETVGLPIRIPHANKLALAGRSLWVTGDTPPIATRIDLDQAG
jgi:hypothetical protein